jgi:hypothetical protein
MKVDKEHGAEFEKALNTALKNGWSRASDAGERATEQPKDRDFFFVCCDQCSSREAAMLAIYRRDAETLYVSDILPKERSELSHDQYNAILEDFHDNVLSKLKVSFPLVFLLMSAEMDVESMMSPQAFEALKHFSALANRATGSAHPMDRDRWYRFLVLLEAAAHRLDGHSLGRWPSS